MGSASYDAPPIALARDAAIILTVRYSSSLATNFFTPLPNVVCLQVQYSDGPEPKVARFRYKLDDNSDPAFPRRIEQIAPVGSSGPYVVKQDDELCVIKLNVDGGYTILFHGYADVGQSDLSSAGEHATFQALGVERREWDTPIAGALFRNGPDPTVVSDVQTERPARFNPDGQPNCTPDGNDAGDHAYDKYPTFLDVNLIRSPDIRSYWTIGKAARFLMEQGNPDETYTKTPDFRLIDDILSAKSPTAGDIFDPAGANVTTTPIPCQDLDTLGDPWPVALAKLVQPHGFNFTFRLDQDDSGKPTTTLAFYRVDDAGNAVVKPVYLQAVGATLDPGQTNVGALSLSRDSSQIANEIVLDTELTRYEASFILAPGFSPSTADLTGTNPNAFVEGDAGFTGAAVDKYRVYVYNEAGDGFWDFPTATFKTTPVGSFDKVLGKPIPSQFGDPPIVQYAARRRPAIGGARVYTKENGQRLHIQLAVSTDFNQPLPCVWDGSGTWHIVSGGWELLKDRLGIRVNVKDVQDWNVGKDTNTSHPYADGKISLITSQNAPVPPTGGNYVKNPRLFFRLTCIIEGDQTFDIVASRRPACISKFSIARRIDCKDRFVKHIIDASSVYNPTSDTATDEDDTDEANAFAEAMRAAHENARFAGSITIPRITMAYSVGDKVNAVIGRNIDLRTNAGGDQGEAAQYPTIVGISWDCESDQSTHLQLADKRAEPAQDRTMGHHDE